MKIFIKYNLRTKRFSGTEFFSGKSIFLNLSQIPFPRDMCIIYHGNGNNIHPSLWKDEWFK